MDIKNTEDLLKKFDYNYQRNKNKLIIEMDFSQRISIDFSNPKNIVISNKLVGWNFLTGIINMNIKNAIFYNLIGGIILSFIIVSLDFRIGTLFGLVFVVWLFSWTTFYLSKSETLRYFLINWNR